MFPEFQKRGNDAHLPIAARIPNIRSSRKEI